MRVKKYLTITLYLLIIILNFSILSTKAYSLGADTAHPYIAKEAFWVWPSFPLTDPNDRNTKDYSKATEVQKEFDQYINIINKLRQGSTEEDYCPQYPLPNSLDNLRCIELEVAGIGIIKCPEWGGCGIPAFHHSYSGWDFGGGKSYCATILGTEIAGALPDVCGESAITWGEKLFNEAVNQYKSGNIEPAYHFLGRIAHLPGDMATPAHVHGDIHWIDFNVMEKDTYEYWMDSIDTKNNYKKWSASDVVGGAIDIDNLPLTDPAESQKIFNALWGTFGTGGLEVLNKSYTSPLYKLFYNLAQITDTYPSNDVEGDNVYLYNFDWAGRKELLCFG